MYYTIDFYFFDGRKKSFIYFTSSRFALSIEISKKLLDYDDISYFVVKTNKLAEKEMEVKL